MLKTLRRWFRYKSLIQHEETGRLTEWPRWKRLPSHRWYWVREAMINELWSTTRLQELENRLEEIRKAYGFQEERDIITPFLPKQETK